MGSPHAIYSISKGPATHCLDQLSIAKGARKGLTDLSKGIASLRSKNFRGLERVFAERLFAPFYSAARIQKVTEYLATYWFNEEMGWWPHLQPIAPIYAVGVLKTLDQSLRGKSRPLPIDSYWILDHPTVELMTLVSKSQVTLLICTPEPGNRQPSGIWGESSKVWVTSRREGKVAAAQVQTKTKT
jgi:hypothetical protein